MLVTSSRRERPDQTIVECPLCGTRLRRNDAPETNEVGRDSLMLVARHRCVPRVHTHSAPSAPDRRADPKSRRRVAGS
jgi:hypothetical protein